MSLSKNASLFLASVEYQLNKITLAQPKELSCFNVLWITTHLTLLTYFSFLVLLTTMKRKLADLL